MNAWAHILVSVFLPKDPFDSFHFPKTSPGDSTESTEFLYLPPSHAQWLSALDVPDAAHAAGLWAQLAPLQLGGHDLTLGLQLPGQAFELQLLEGAQKREGTSVSLGIQRQSAAFFLLSKVGLFVSTNSHSHNHVAHRCQTIVALVANMGHSDILISPQGFTKSLLEVAHYYY